jgi:hypothetical protein
MIHGPKQKCRPVASLYPARRHGFLFKECKPRVMLQHPKLNYVFVTFLEHQMHYGLKSIGEVV